MIIYDHRPPPDVLIDFAFQRYADAPKIRLHMEDAHATYQDYEHLDATRQGPMLNLTLSGVWSLFKAEQELWQQQHPHELVTRP